MFNTSIKVGQILTVFQGTSIFCLRYFVFFDDFFSLNAGQCPDYTEDGKIKLREMGTLSYIVSYTRVN